MTDIEQIRTALPYIASDDRDTWIKVGMALHSELGNSGFCLWDEWSQSADSYNQRDAESVWNSFSSDGSVGIGSLFHFAQKSGWQWEGPSPSQEEIAQQKADIEARNRKAEAERHRKQNHAAQLSQTLWRSGLPVNENPYLAKKDCNSTDTLKQLPIDEVSLILGYHPKSHGEYLQGETLLVPIVIDGAISTIEMIDEAGRKSAVKGGKKSGGYWAAQKLPEDNEYSDSLIVGEGVATVLSSKQATGYPVVAALSCHNLRLVAAHLRECYPKAKIIILADIGNGQKDAERAAIETKSLLSLPELPDGILGTDFNDLFQISGVDEVKRQIEKASGLPQIKGIEKPSDESIQKLVTELADLSPIEYDQCREDRAKELGVRVSVLDKAVQDQKKQKTQQRQSLFPDDEPWPEPVDGETLVNDLCSTFERFSILPPGSSLALSLWTILTYCYDQFRVLPLILITAPEKRCGKSTTLTTLADLCQRSMTASNISPAAMYRTIEKYHPTLLVDEGDTFLKGNDDLRSILNSGHTKTSAYVVRCDGDDNEPKAFSTWCPKALSMIGLPPDTILDRSIIVPLRRKLQGETVVSDYDRDEALSQEMRRKIAAFAEDNIEPIRSARPERLATNNDRLADNWNTLLSIASAISPECLMQARKAATVLVDDKADENPSVQLLADIKEVFQSSRMSSKALVQRLISLEERPWCEWRKGNPMTANTLSKMLKPFDIRSGLIRDGADVYRGYKQEDFEDVFKRYLPSSPAAVGDETVTTLQDSNIKYLSGKGNVTQSRNVTLLNHPKTLKSLSCNNVTFQQSDTAPEDGMETPLLISAEDII